MLQVGSSHLKHVELKILFHTNKLNSFKNTHKNNFQVGTCTHCSTSLENFKSLLPVVVLTYLNIQYSTNLCLSLTQSDSPLFIISTQEAVVEEFLVKKTYLPLLILLLLALALVFLNHFCNKCRFYCTMVFTTYLCSSINPICLNLKSKQLRSTRHHTLCKYKRLPLMSQLLPLHAAKVCEVFKATLTASI